MNFKTATLMATAFLCLCSSARAQFGSAGGAQGPVTPHVQPSAPDDLPEPEARGEDLRLQGKCNRAIPIFRRLASNGAGYELAQYNLGLCLFDIAKVDADAAHATSLRQEGAATILMAANANLPKAQISLVGVYLDGTGVPPDPIEAGKWSLIYHGNEARRAISMPDVSSDMKARLDAVLTDKTWDIAIARANAWTPMMQHFDK